MSAPSSHPLRRALRLWASLALLCALVARPARADERPLPSWRDGPSRAAILAFVADVTTPGGPKFVPPEERVAVFDNDGTLWAEMPVYAQLAFAFDRVKALAPAHPEWKEREPFKSVLAGDLKGALAGGEKALLEVVAATHAGTTPDEFAAVVRDWIATARHPTLDRPYTACVYAPMLELLAYLRAHGFSTWVVSGGGVEFMRPWAEAVYGIPPQQVIGSRIRMRHEVRDGKPVLLRLPEVDFIDDKAGKVIGIHQAIGRRPIAAFGNSDGDLEMLAWTTAGAGARLGVLVHHTDAEREWAYDRASHVGRLDKALDAAPAAGWVVVDMKTAWERVFPAK